MGFGVGPHAGPADGGGQAVTPALPIRRRAGPTAGSTGRGGNVPLLLAFAGLGLVLCLTQAFGISPDLDQYELFFDTLREGGLQAVEGRRFESGFTLLTYWLARGIPSNLMLISVLAFACMLAKGWTLQAVSGTRVVLVALCAYYLLRVFPLHELTQLRVSIAIAFLLLAQIAVWSDRRMLAVLACALALSFHTSAVAAMPFLFLQPVTRWKTLLLALAVFLATRIQLASMLNMAGDVLTPVELYQKSGFGDRPANPVSLALLLDWSMMLYALLRWNLLSTYARRALVLPLVGLALYYGAMPYPVVAHRLFEMFSVFWLLFLAGALAQPATRLAAAGFMLLSGSWYSYIYIFSDRIFK
jgi:hypothetical protein